MDNRLVEIYENTIPHSSFLSERAIISCMKQSYKMGTQDVLEWLSKMDYLSDNINYIIKEWENQNSENDTRGNHR